MVFSQLVRGLAQAAGRKMRSAAERSAQRHALHTTRSLRAKPFSEKPWYDPKAELRLDEKIILGTLYGGCVAVFVAEFLRTEKDIYEDAIDKARETYGDRFENREKYIAEARKLFDEVD